MKKIGIALLGVILAAGLFFIFKVGQFYKYIYTPKSGLGILKPQTEKSNYSILLLGYGGFYGGVQHEGGYLTDTMMVVNIDTKQKKVHLISIPRDLWVKLPTKSGEDFHNKINTVYQTELFPETFPDVDKKYSGSKEDAALTKYIVGGITGLTIDNYAGIDFKGFAAIIDRIGGVDVNVEKTFDDYEYPIDGKEKDLCGKDEQFKLIEPYLNDGGDATEEQKLFTEKPDLEKFFKDITEDPVSAFPCRYEHLHFDRGLTHMDGAKALKYVRSRHSLQDGTDFGRAARQQKLIEAIKNKVLTVSFIPQIVPLMDEAKEYIKTDISPDDISLLVKEIPNAKDYKISTIVLSPTNVLKLGRSSDGQSILMPSIGMDAWSGVRAMIKNSIAGITPPPTASPSATLKPVKK